MLSYQAEVGDTIEQAARAMLDLANHNNAQVEGTFNFATIVVEPDPSYDVDKVVKRLEAANKDHCRRVAETPEGQRRAQADAYLVAVLRRELNTAMRDLGTLNFRDLSAVIAWLESIAEATDRSDIECPWQQILTEFAANGFAPNMNLGEYNDADNGDAVARYIIGQALAWLAGDIHAIPRIFDECASEWRAKFGR